MYQHKFRFVCVWIFLLLLTDQIERERESRAAKRFGQMLGLLYNSTSCSVCWNSGGQVAVLYVRLEALSGCKWLAATRTEPKRPPDGGC